MIAQTKRQYIVQRYMPDSSCLRNHNVDIKNEEKLATCHEACPALSRVSCLASLTVPLFHILKNSMEFRNTNIGLPATIISIVLMCLAISMFAVLDTTAKYLSTILLFPVMQVIWLRFAGHIILSLFLLAPLTPQELMRSSKPGLQILRSVFMAGATFFNFLAPDYLQLDQTATIFFLAPMMVAALAGPLLGEWIGWHRFAAIVIGFLGVLAMFRPGMSTIHWAVLLSLAATLCYALYNITTRHLASFDNSEVTQFYTPFAGFVLSMPFAISGWVWPQDAFSWFLLAALGLVGGFGHWLLIKAHRQAPAAILAPFVYTGLIPMVLLGYLVFDDIPSPWTLAGGAVIVASGLYLLRREYSSP